jgi:hypothetical protein
MAFELNTGNDIGFLVAAADYQTTSKQYYIVDCGADNTATLASVAGQAAIGVLQNDPAAGEAAIVRTGGVSKVIVGTGDITAGDLVQTDATGAAIAAAGSDYTVGVCLVGASAGEYATILVTPSAGQVN